MIFRHQGTVEQLIGDEIVALFGLAEDGAATRPRRAVRAAIDMVAAVGASPRWAAEGRPRFDIGVGIASGPVLAGTIGSARAPRADRRRPPDDRGRAHPAHDTPVRRAYNRRRGRRSAEVQPLVRYRELGTPEAQGAEGRETLYEVLGPRRRRRTPVAAIPLPAKDD